MFAATNEGCENVCLMCLIAEGLLCSCKPWTGSADGVVEIKKTLWRKRPVIAV